MWEGKEWVLFHDLLSFPFLVLKKNWGEGEARLSKNPKTQCPCRARVCPGLKSCLELGGRGGRRCAVRPQMLWGLDVGDIFWTVHPSFGHLVAEIIPGALRGSAQHRNPPGSLNLLGLEVAQPQCPDRSGCTFPAYTGEFLGLA